MRHGYEWWEAFWKWLLKRLEGELVGTMTLKQLYKEFESLWREGKVQRSP